uniref:G domain-containing protein n=1 Tax=Haptolina ericina TaxID=156174 RepID=A0A7S3FDX9_9EUKA|mmetsp:Transcript_64258/g.143593  ORF Transcript_64258/g.143593 Transcript_64258/m.143593 type:complete len:503 (+) Transcript_64258:30-1538(+)
MSTATMRTSDPTDKENAAPRGEAKVVPTAPASKESTTSGTAPEVQQPAVAGLDVQAMDLVKTFATKLRKTGRRSKLNELYLTLEDFERADPEKKRVVFIGCTGAGKSTIGNIASGWRLVGRQADDGEYAFDWKHPTDMRPLFEARADGESVTSKTAFANVHWLGDEARPIIVVDTPGHDDTAGTNLESKEARDKLGELAADLHTKLKALGSVHAIVILHNDVVSNRLNPATQTVLKMVGDKFAKADSSVWANVVVAYSKCNEHESTWRSGLAQKKASLQSLVRELSGTSIEVPVVTLGGAEPEGGAANATRGYEELWSFIEKARPLDTSKLQPFEGSDIKWQKLVDAKNDAEARAAAAVAHMLVVFKIVALSCFLFWRGMMLPTFAGVLFLNVPATAFDELAILLFVVYRMGPTHVIYSVNHFCQQLIFPYVRGPMLKYCTAAETQLRAAGITPLADACVSLRRVLAEPEAPGAAPGSRSGKSTWEVVSEAVRTGQIKKKAD